MTIKISQTTKQTATTKKKSIASYYSRERPEAIWTMSCQSMRLLCHKVRLCDFEIDPLCGFAWLANSCGFAMAVLTTHTRWSLWMIIFISKCHKKENAHCNLHVVPGCRFSAVTFAMIRDGIKSHPLEPHHIRDSINWWPHNRSLLGTWWSACTVIS